MDEYKCKNCGGTINAATGVCPYCGSKYKIERDNSVVQVITAYTNPVKTIAAETILNRTLLCYAKPEQAQEFAIEKLKYQLADALTSVMEVYTHHDLIDDQIHVRGVVHVVPPGYHFY